MGGKWPNEKVNEARAKKREWLNSFRLNKKCLYCEETHPACLDWHHRNPIEKMFALSTAIENNRSREAILIEMAKCDLICRNCHAKLHWG